MRWSSNEIQCTVYVRHIHGTKATTFILALSMRQRLPENNQTCLDPKVSDKQILVWKSNRISFVILISFSDIYVISKFRGTKENFAIS